MHFWHQPACQQIDSAFFGKQLNFDFCDTFGMNTQKVFLPKVPQKVNILENEKLSFFQNADVQLFFLTVMLSASIN